MANSHTLGTFSSPALGWADIEVPIRFVDMDSWKRLACYPRGSFYPLSFGLVLESNKLPHSKIAPWMWKYIVAVGSLSYTFVSRRHVRLRVKPACAFTRHGRFPFVLSWPLSPSVTFWEGFAPNKLPARHCLPWASPFFCLKKYTFPRFKHSRLITDLSFRGWNWIETKGRCSQEVRI